MTGARHVTKLDARRLLPTTVIRRAWLPTALALLVLAPVACRSAARQPPPPCDGGRTLVVRNQSRFTLDIYAVRGMSEDMLGSAGPGRTEFRPSRDGTAFRARQAGTRITAPAGVTFELVCPS
jgi:hypothetical protein